MKLFDVVFISYSENSAENNWKHLLSLVPYAKRVHGVEGINNAYNQASKLSDTSNFFTVDGDNRVCSDFSWKNIKNLDDNINCVHTWRCENAVNGLVYGYGGVKLWPQNLFKEIKNNYLDFTTTVAKNGYFIQEDVASITRFNTTEEEAWRAGFRECVKLSSECIRRFDKQSNERLLTWMRKGIDTEFGYWTILGSRMGCLYGNKYKGSPTNLSVINNFEDLKKIFNSIKDRDPKVEVKYLDNELLGVGYKQLELIK